MSNSLFDVQPQDAYQVRVVQPGYLVGWNKKPGDYVQMNEPIAQLRNLPLESTLAQRLSVRDVAKVQLEQTSLLSPNDPSKSSTLQSQREQLKSAEEQLVLIKDDINHLEILAQRNGVIIEPPTKEDQAEKYDEDQLSSWSGSPFAPSNFNAYFAENDLLCYVADPSKMEAVMIVDQADFELLKTGDPVEMMLDSARLNSVHGTIEHLSKMQIEEKHRIHLHHNQEDRWTRLRCLRPNAAGQRSYQRMSHHQSTCATASWLSWTSLKIHMEWKSLGWRFLRYLNKTFKFEF